MTTRLSFHIEQLRPVGDGYVAHGQFFNKPTLITQMRCERHSQAAIDDDIIEGIGYYGLRKLLEPYGDIGYAVGTEMNRDGTPRIDVRFYNLRSSQENER